jgi:hypothetical protein
MYEGRARLGVNYVHPVMPCTEILEVYNEELYLRRNEGIVQRVGTCMYNQLNVAALNIEQQRGFEQIFRESLCTGRSTRARKVFFLVKALSSALRAHGDIVLIVGSSALCAIAYDHGHSSPHVRNTCP